MVQERGTAAHIVSVARKQRLEVRLDHKTSSQPFSDLSLARFYLQRSHSGQNSATG